MGGPPTAGKVEILKDNKTERIILWINKDGDLSEFTGKISIPVRY